MDLVLLDTDTLNEVLKRRNAEVVQHATDYLQQHGQFAISSMSRYEVLRGLREKQATVQLAKFDAFCLKTLVLPITDAILDRTANLWVAARRGGHPGKDADLIIAATALEYGRTLVTGNTFHFAWIPGLKVEDWRLP